VIPLPDDGEPGTEAGFGQGGLLAASWAVGYSAYKYGGTAHPDPGFKILETLPSKKGGFMT
jgi:hypothetical protein